MSRNRLSLFFCASVAALTLFSKPALAGAYTEDLTKCLVASTTTEDKAVLARWVFAILALHPDTASLAAVSDAQRAEFNAKTARLFERLVTETCKTQTQATVRNEGPAAIQSSFKSFGEVATRELLANPKVVNGISNAASNLDFIKLISVLQ